MQIDSNEESQVSSDVAHSSRWTFLGEAAFIAGISAVWYVGVYRFETSYCNYWKLPNEFISIGLERVTSLSVIFWFLLILVINPVLMRLKILLTRKTARYLLVPSLWIILTILFLAVDENLRKAWWILLFFNVFLLIVWFGIPASIARKRGVSFDEGIKISNEIDSQTFDIIGWVFKKLGEMGPPLLGLFFIAIVGAHLGGAAAARWQREFTVLEYEPSNVQDSCKTVVVIRKYDDRLFCNVVDTCLGKIVGRIFVLDTKALVDKAITMNPMYVGPFKRSSSDSTNEDGFDPSNAKQHAIDSSSRN